MNERAICLPWDKIFCLDTLPLGQTVVYGELRKMYKGIRRYPSVSILPGADTEKSFLGGTLYWGEPERAPHYRGLRDHVHRPTDRPTDRPTVSVPYT